MSYAIVTSMALVALAQAQPGPGGSAAPGATGVLAPNRIKMDFDDRTLAEIVEGLNAQVASSVVIRPESKVQIGGELPKPSPPPRRFTVHERSAVTFWEAIERVCRATSSWPSVEALPGAAGRSPTARVVLAPASADRGFACNDGAFRAVLTRLFYVREVRLAPAYLSGQAGDHASRDGPSDETTFAAELIIMAEPRLRFERVGDLTIGRAIDDQGNNLTRARQARQAPKVQDGVISQDGGSVWLPLLLNYPGEPRKLIKQLAGRVSVQVSTRQKEGQTVATDVVFDFADVPMP
jgi:hypothetical protein